MEKAQWRPTVRTYIQREVLPYAEKWETARLADRSANEAAGKYGLIGFTMPEQFGGSGIDDLRFDTVVIQELAKVGSITPALGLQNDVVGPYLASLATLSSRPAGFRASSRGR